MGEVVERPRRAAAPQAPAAPVAPFPVATHRRQSKFALGRQQQRSGGGGLTAPRPPPADDINTNEPPVPEARGVAAENAARLAGMSAEEREEALEEVRGRLPASVLEFLRRRGQQRLGAGGAAGAAATAKAATTTAAPKPPRPPPPPRPEQPPSSSSLPPAARVRFSLAYGAPVGVLPPTDADAADADKGAAESALERDPLRFGPGSEDLGYTCDELAALSRSAHAPQRQAALRGLAAVLRRARPRVADVQAPPNPPLRLRPVFVNAKSSSPSWSDVWDYLVVVLRVAIPLRAALDDAHGGAAAAAAEALAALLAPSPQEALAVEACCDGGGGGGAVGGWPAPWSAATLRRAGPDAPWETAADLAAAAEEAAAAAAEQKQQKQQKPKAKGEDEGEDEEEPPPAPEDIAAVDPMCGFLATDPLPRVRFLLAQAAGRGEGDDPAARAAAPHLLAVLAAAARSGPQGALAVARCPGLLAAVVALLQPDDGGGGESGASADAAPTPPSTRLAAMALARAICQASAATAQLARSAGLLAQAQLALAEQAGGGLQQHALPLLLLLRLEALRAWRAAALHGVLDPGMHMDVMYANGGLCELLAPPPPPPGDGQEGEEKGDVAAAALAALPWRLRAEAFSLAAALVAHAQATSSSPDAAPPGLSPGCAAALAEGAAADWLCNDALRRVEVAFSSSAPAAPPPPPLPPPPLHPSLALPPAAAPAAALAAAVQYLAVYWRSVGGPPRGDVRDGLVGRLIGVGLLLLQGDGDEDGDGGADADGACVGAALLRHCVYVASRRADDADDEEDPDGNQLLQSYATAAPALALVSAAAALASAVGEPGSARALARRALFGVGSSNGMCEGALSLAERWSRRAPCVMEPWRLMRAMLWQPRLRLLTELARPLLLLPPPKGDESAAAAADDDQETARLADALLAVPALGLPGAEADAMEALALAFCPKCLAQPLARAQEALCALDESATGGGDLRPAALAAQGASRWWAGERAEGPEALRFQYPLPSQLPAPEALSEVLTQGYAAAWLSMVALEGEGGGRGESSGYAANAAAAAAIPLRRPMLDEGTGSRLPLPAHWILTEILAVPNRPSSPPPQRPHHHHPAGAALLWVLGLDRSGPSSPPSAYLARAVPHASVRLQGVLRLAYMFNTQELVVTGAGGGGGGGKGRASASAAAAAAALEAPLFRWPLAALVARWTERAVEDWRRQTGAEEPPLLWTDALFVQRLAELAGSLHAGGDLLAASHAALALSPALASPAARVAAWRALADVQALERLPPVVVCPGGALALCCPLGEEGCCCLDGGGDDKEGGGEGEGGGGEGRSRALASLYFSWSAREFSNACAQSLAAGKLAKSQALGGLAAACAVHAVAARALADDAAWEGGRGGERNNAATNALRGVVRGAPAGTAGVVVRCAARCGGIGTREATRRAVVACYGDAELMGALSKDGVV
jgi:hypothetical protein